MVGLALLLTTTGLTEHVQAVKSPVGATGVKPSTSEGGNNCNVYDANGNLVLSGKITVNTSTLLSCLGTVTGNGHTPVLFTNANTGVSCNSPIFGSTNNWANVVAPTGQVLLMCQAAPAPSG